MSIGAPGACFRALVTASWTTREVASAALLGQVADVADELARYGQAGCPDPAHELFDDAQAGRWIGRRRGVENFDQAVDLGFGLAGRFANRLERLGGAAGVLADEVSAGVGLDDHEAHAVGDDVVQLTGDPGSFVAHRLDGEELAFLLELTGAQLELARPRPPGGDDQAGEPGRRPSSRATG